MLTDPIADMLTRIRNANRALQEAKRRKPENGNGQVKDAEDQLADDFVSISRLSGGIAAVIIPVVRNLAATAAKLVS